MAKYMTTEEIISLILITFIFVGGAVGNLFVATIIIRHKRMRTITNWFVLNLSLCDLIIVLFIIPINTIVPHVNWPFGTFGCEYIAPILEHFAGVCVLTHTCLGLARYAVLRRSMSGRTVSINHVRVTIALVWLIPLITMSVSVMPGLMADPTIVMRENLGMTTCFIIFRSPEMKMAYKILTFSLTYIIPMTATGFAYYRIHCMVSKSMKHLNGHMSKFALQTRRNKSRRMNRALMMMYIMFGLTTLPLQLLYLIDTLGNIPTNYASALTHQFFMALFYGQVVTNPLVLFYMGEEYRKEVYRLPVCICRPKLRKLSVVATNMYRFHQRLKDRRKSSSPAVLLTTEHGSYTPAGSVTLKPPKRASTPLENKQNYAVYAVQNSYSQEEDTSSAKETDNSHFEPANSHYLHCSSGNSDPDILPNRNSAILRNSVSSSKDSSNSSTTSLNQRKSFTFKNRERKIGQNLGNPKPENCCFENDSTTKLDTKDTDSIEKLNSNNRNSIEKLNLNNRDSIEELNSNNRDSIEELNCKVDFQNIISSTPVPAGTKTIQPARLTDRYLQQDIFTTDSEQLVTRAEEMKVSAYYDDGSLLYFYDAVVGRVSLSDDDGRETHI